MKSTPGSITKQSDAIEKVILGLFASLILKVALDRACPVVQTQRDGTDIVNVITATVYSGTTVNVAILVLTLIRFVIGVHRVSEETASNCIGPLSRLWNLLSAVILFILFYATGAAITWAPLFYVCMGAVHAWDFLWFLSLFVFCSGTLHEPLRNAAQKFIALDLITCVLCLVMAFWWRTTPQSNVPCLVAPIGMILVAIADFWWNWNFFLATERTLTETEPAV